MKAKLSSKPILLSSLETKYILATIVLATIAITLTNFSNSREKN